MNYLDCTKTADLLYKCIDELREEIIDVVEKMDEGDLDSMTDLFVDLHNLLDNWRKIIRVREDFERARNNGK